MSIKEDVERLEKFLDENNLEITTCCTFTIRNINTNEQVEKVYL